MGDPRNTEDVQKAVEAIKAQGRPPFECPFCKKSYQSLTGAFYHLGAAPPHNDLIPRCIVPAPAVVARATGRNTPKSSSRSQSPASILRKKIRQPLTYEESQRLVEVKLHNDYYRIQIDDDVALGSNKDRGSDPEESGVYSNPATPTNTMRSKGKCSKSSKSSKRKGTSKLTANTEENSKPDLVQLPAIEVEVVDDMDYPEAPDRVSAYFRYIEQSFEELDDIVEYDMDDEDYHWLDMINEKRKEEGLPSASQDCFELLMDRFEKECFFESHLTTDPNEANPYNIDENAVCCICNDGECHNTNAILFCDMCNLAVHQECYGIPYIPEGQWLCRRCMHSPSRMVSCVLCPNKGGAFKQTAEGRWAHMLCALWIPEVQFANPVFLEPIDNIEKIPPARWRLTCYVCKRRYGACIQCSSKNCFIAFHVSCAQQKGFYMKVEPCGTTDSGIKKVAYCKMHSPRRGSTVEDVLPVDIEGTGEEPTEEQDGEEGAKEQDLDSDPETALKPRTTVPPIVNLPFVPQHRLNRISAKVNLSRKTQFIPMLVSYWKLKRQSRNGVPLIRRLQASSHGQRVNMYKLSEEELDTLKEQLSVWKNLRHDLERVRMLAELARRREKQKRELVHLAHQVFEYKDSPDVCLMKKILHQLKKKDAADIFADPVPLDDVPDYLDVIKEPMDFSTMEKKINSLKYLTLEDFEKDFTLVWRNAMTYNEPTTVYYRAALRIKLEGQKMLKVARDSLSKYNSDPLQGFSPFYSGITTSEGDVPASSTSEGATVQTNPSRKGLSDDTPVSPTALEERLEILQQQLHSVDKQSIRVRAQKKKELELEVARLRKQVKRKRKAALNSSGIDPGILLDIALSPEPPKPTRSSRKTAPVSSSHQTTSQDSSIRLKSPTPESPALVSTSNSKSRHAGFTSSTDQEKEPREKKPRSRDSRSQSRRRPPPSKHIADNSEKKAKVEEELSPDESASVQKSRSSFVKNAPKRSRSSRKDKRKGVSTDSEPLDGGPHLPKLSTTKQNSGSEQVDGATADTEDHISDTGDREEKRSRVRQKRVGAKRPSGSRLRKTGTPKQNHSEDKQEHEATDKGKENITAADVNTVPTATTESMLTTQMSPKRNQKLSNSGTKATRRRGSSRKPPSRRRPRSKLLLSSTDDDETGEEKQPSQPTDKRRNSSQEKESKREESENEPLLIVAEEDEEEREEEEDEDNDDSKSGSSSNTSTANDIPFSNLGVEPYEGDGLHHWDVVWAKCPGYPLYPALIVDPRVPKKGFRYYGAQVKCPTDEVFKLKKKAPRNSFLVNFFDARRTWYWLPGSKLDKLGTTPEGDESVMKQCPTRSKRAVQQAYQRATTFMKTVAAGKRELSQDKQEAHQPVNGPTTAHLRDGCESMDVSEPDFSSTSGNSKTGRKNSIPNTTSSNSLDGTEQEKHHRVHGVNIWNRNSDEVAAAEQLALLNSYVPDSFHDGRSRAMVGDSHTAVNNSQHLAGNVEQDKYDREDMETTLSQGNCKHRNVNREDEFIGEDTSTSSISGTPEVSSIA